jgi:hypothetical protein
VLLFARKAQFANFNCHSQDPVEVVRALPTDVVEDFFQLRGRQANTRERVPHMEEVVCNEFAHQLIHHMAHLGRISSAAREELVKVLTNNIALE